MEAAPAQSAGQGSAAEVFATFLYDPVWTSAVIAPSDFAIASIGFVLLAATRVSTLVVAAWCEGASLLRTAVQLG